ncbi:MAG: transglycosylase SLT domain-containing protein [Deltaproteobacteria bacterium]|nr:transglycosylase SLT domain-containing protein [Deltaproteobacteria bacterium]
MQPNRKGGRVTVYQWLGLTLALVFFTVMLGGGFTGNLSVFQSETLPTPISSENPFSLVSLHKRLDAKAIQRVQNFVHYYSRTTRVGFEGSLARSTRYVEAFRRIFRQKGLPEELAYLPLIESGFQEHAVSNANAVGVWQFIDSTGSRFNLKRTEYTDAKRDPIASAEAAAAYFQYLHRMFGNWEMALAAYNAGEGTIRRAIRENQKAGKPTGYWSLDLPAETQGYVPAFLASMIIAKNPGAFGFHRIDFQPAMAFDQIKVHPGTRLSALADQLELSLSDLLELNPELLAGVVPPDGGIYHLKIPRGLKRSLAQRIGAIQPKQDWMLYPAGPNQTVSEVAATLRKPSKPIQQLNRLSGDSPVAPGRLLIIPL